MIDWERYLNSMLDIAPPTIIDDEKLRLLANQTVANQLIESYRNVETRLKEIRKSVRVVDPNEDVLNLDNRAIFNCQKRQFVYATELQLI